MRRLSYRSTLWLTAALMLAACTSDLWQRRAFLDKLVGSSEADVIRELGVPSQQVMAQGHRFISYTDKHRPESCGVTFDILQGNVQSYILRREMC